MEEVVQYDLCITFEREIIVVVSLWVCLSYGKYFICFVLNINFTLVEYLNTIMRNKIIFFLFALTQADFLDSVLPKTCP